MDETEIARLRSQHGPDVTTMTAAGVTIAVRPPTMAEWERFQDSAADKRSKPARALAQLVRDCLVSDRAAYDAACERRPALPTTFGSEVVKLAGLVDEVEVGKA